MRQGHRELPCGEAPCGFTTRSHSIYAQDAPTPISQSWESTPKNKLLLTVNPGLSPTGVPKDVTLQCPTTDPIEEMRDASDERLLGHWSVAQCLLEAARQVVLKQGGMALQSVTPEGTASHDYAGIAVLHPADGTQPHPRSTQLNAVHKPPMKHNTSSAICIRSHPAPLGWGGMGCCRVGLSCIPLLGWGHGPL